MGQHPHDSQNTEVPRVTDLCLPRGQNKYCCREEPILTLSWNCFLLLKIYWGEMSVKQYEKIEETNNKDLK